MCKSNNGENIAHEIVFINLLNVVVCFGSIGLTYSDVNANGGLLLGLLTMPLEMLFPMPNMRSLFKSAIRGMEIADGGIIMSRKVPK